MPFSGSKTNSTFSPPHQCCNVRRILTYAPENSSGFIEQRGWPAESQGSVTVTVTTTHFATPEWCTSKPTSTLPLLSTSCTTKTSTISDTTSIDHKHEWGSAAT